MSAFIYSYNYHDCSFDCHPSFCPHELISLVYLTHSHQYLLMQSGQQGQGRRFSLTILTVSMKVKFPCQMILEHQSQSITQEVAPTAHTFNFDCPVSLLIPASGSAITVAIRNNKGSKYTAGSVSLVPSDVLASVGSSMLLPVTRCLDPEAHCQFRVDGVTAGTPTASVIASPTKVQSPMTSLRKISSQGQLINETKSEVNPPLFQENRHFQTGPKTQVFKTFTKSPTSKVWRGKMGLSSPGGGAFEGEWAGREGVSVGQAEVYREGYNKLKDKFKRESELLREESQKRMATEANEHNLKLQVMKLKVRCEEKDKQISEKNDKIRQMGLSLSELQKKDLDMAYLREQNGNLKNKQTLLSDTIGALTKDNEALKKLMSDKWNLSQQTVKGLREELDKTRSKYDEQHYQLQVELQGKESVLASKTHDLTLRDATIERQKKLVKQLETQSEQKIIDFEKTLADQRSQLQHQIASLKQRLAEKDQEVQSLKGEMAQAEARWERLASDKEAVEYSMKVMEQEGAVMRGELEQWAGSKEKLVQLTREHQALQEQFGTAKKQLDLALADKEVDLKEMVAHYEEAKLRDHQQRVQSEQKIKNAISRSQQLEKELEEGRIGHDKKERQFETTNRQNALLQEQKSALQGELRATEKRCIELEQQHALLYSQQQRDVSHSQAQLDKARRDLVQAQTDNQALRAEVEVVQHNDSDLKKQVAQLGAKERNLKQQSAKSAAIAKDNTARLESEKEELEVSLAQEKRSLEKAEQEKSQVHRKLAEMQIDEISRKEQLDKQRKTITLNSEKISSLQLQLVQKNEEIAELGSTLKKSESKADNLQQANGKLKEQLAHEANTSSKKTKMNEMIAADLKKAREDLKQLTDSIRSMERVEIEIREEVKLHKEATAKERLSRTRVENEFEKFKEVISDIIRMEFSKILTTAHTTRRSTQRLRESQASAPSERSSQRGSLEPSVLANTLLGRLQEVKGNVTRLGEYSRVLRQENLRLVEESESETHRHEFAQMEMQRDIQLLEDEVENIMTDKESECQNYDNLLVELNFRVKEKEGELEEARAEIEEYQAIVGGIRHDFEANNELNEKKVSSLKASVGELSERVEYLNLNVACLEDKNHELEEQNIEQEQELVNCKQLLIKTEQGLLEASRQSAQHQHQHEAAARDNKRLSEALGEAELEVAAQLETKVKYESLLEEEEKKVQKLNDFVSGLILEKEAAIKRELQMSEQVDSLDNQLLEERHAREALAEDCQILRSKLNEGREEMKEQLREMKTAQQGLAEERVKSSRGAEKVKELKGDIEIRREYTRELEEKYRQLRDKNYKEIHQLSCELEDQNGATLELTKQLNDKIAAAERQNQRAAERNQQLGRQLEGAQGQLQEERDRGEELNLQLLRVQEQLASAEEELGSQESLVQVKNQEIDHLEEQVDEQSRRVMALEEEMHTQEQEFNGRLTDLANELHLRSDREASEHKIKMQQAKHEIDSLKEQLRVAEEERQHAQHEAKSCDTNSKNIEESWKQKLTALESQRLSSAAEKNEEIRKLSEEGKGQLERTREKEQEVRRLSLELEKVKLALSRADNTSAHAEEQAKNRERVLQREMEAVRLQHRQLIAFKEKSMAALQANEVEVRRVIAGGMKSVAERVSGEEGERVLAVLRGLESGVVEAMMRRVESLE